MKALIGVKKLGLVIVQFNNNRLQNQAVLLFWSTEMARKSIGEKLKTSQKKEARREYAHKWADEWESRYLYLLKQLKWAIADDDQRRIERVFGDLRGLQEPKFFALHNVIDELIDPTRPLIDDK